MMVERGIPMGIADKGLVTERLMEAYRAPFPFPDDRVGVLRFVRMVPTRSGDEGYETFGEIEAGLRSLDVPVRVMWARRDFAFPKRIAHRFMELMPQGDVSRITDVPHASHFLQEEAHEEIAATIREAMTEGG
jgi:pimeloyl-ACP methyl ester carboxylesterase